MPRPTSVADAAPVRVVIVTMDAHLVSATDRARVQLAREIPGLRLSVHTAATWGDDAAALERCKTDIAQGDVVIATMLFMEEHFLPVLPALKARRAACDAMVCAMSATEVTQLTRMGSLDMNGPPSGMVALLKRLRGKAGGRPGGDTGTASSGARQMKMLRRLPKILRFIPGTAQDLRAYFLTLQYWLAGSEENVANMVRFLVDRYADGPRKGLRGLAKTHPPVEYPEVGVYHPRIKGRLADNVDALPPAARAGDRGTVGVLLLRSYLLAGNTGHYNGVIAALEARGLSVLPVFATGLDSRPAIEAFFVRDGRPVVDAVVSLTGLLARRRSGLQRRAGRRGDPRPPRRSLPRGHADRVPDARAVGRLGAGPPAGRVHDDGGDPRARRRDRLDGVRRSQRRQPRALHRMRARAAPSKAPTPRTTCRSAASARTCWPPASTGWSRCAARARAERKVAVVALQLPAERRATPAPPRSCRCSSRCTTRSSR